MKFIKNCKNFIIFRTFWTLDEDIILLMESLSNPKKWAEISKKLPGRTQHHVKNRFIRLLANEIGVKREIIRKSLNENSFFGLLYRVYEELKTRKNAENSKNSEIKESMIRKNAKNEKIEYQSEESENYLNLSEYVLFKDIL